MSIKINNFNLELPIEGLDELDNRVAPKSLGNFPIKDSIKEIVYYDDEDLTSYKHINSKENKVEFTNYLSESTIDILREIYEYVDANRKQLNSQKFPISSGRAFSANEKNSKFVERVIKGRWPNKNPLEDEMENLFHWRIGGKTIPDNLKDNQIKDKARIFTTFNFETGLLKIILFDPFHLLMNNLEMFPEAINENIENSICHSKIFDQFLNK